MKNKLISHVETGYPIVENDYRIVKNDIQSA